PAQARPSEVGSETLPRLNPPRTRCLADFFRGRFACGLAARKRFRLTRKSHGGDTSWLRRSAKTRGLTTPSQGGHDLSWKHRVPRRRVDGAVRPQCFRPVRAPPLVLCEKV